MNRMTTLLLSACLSLISAQAGSAHAALCRQSMLPVDLELALPLPLFGNPTTLLAGEKVFVRLCLPDGAAPSTALVLLPGITYDNLYWDIEDPSGGTDRYSFVAAATEAGYATVAIDRIGTGQSSRPLSVLIDIDQNAFVVHQVVQALRDGDIAGPSGPVSFPKVVTIGHSYGSATAWVEAHRFQDVDGLIATGMAHEFRLVPFIFIIPINLYPAAIDPKFLLELLDPGYMTTRPGTRYDSFYAPSTDVDPAVIAQDEATKETVTDTEITSILTFLELIPHIDIRVPSLIVMGEKDAVFCSQHPGDLGADCTSAQTLADGERPWYGPNTPCLDAFITPGAGHGLNAMFSSQTSFGAMLDWLDDVITPGPGTPGC